MIALHALAPFVARRAEEEEARCELCAAPLPGAHRHVIEPGTRGARCACQACAILFTQGARYRTVPDRVLRDAAFAMTSDRWARLGIPVGIAVFFRDSTRDQVFACYPGPAGIVDAEIEPEVWREIEAASPLARALEADVEALLVRSQRETAAMSCHLVPITAAYELAGRLRACWSGFTGGEQVRRELAAFFAELDQRGGQRGGRRGDPGDGRRGDPGDGPRGDQRGDHGGGAP